MGCQVLTFEFAIGLDWIRVDQIGLATYIQTGQGSKQLNQNLSTSRVTSRLYKESRPCLVLVEYNVEKRKMNEKFKPG